MQSLDLKEAIYIKLIGFFLIFVFAEHVKWDRNKMCTKRLFSADYISGTEFWQSCKPWCEYLHTCYSLQDCRDSRWLAGTGQWTSKSYLLEGQTERRLCTLIRVLLVRVDKVQSLVRGSEAMEDDRVDVKLTLGSGLSCLRQTARADKLACRLPRSVCAETDY